MPCANITVSCKVPKAQADVIVQKACKILSDVIGKPISYCMATLAVLDGGGSMDGESATPVGFVSVQSIGGLSPKVNKKLSSGFCSMLNEVLEIDMDRIYMNFKTFSGSSWGYNKSTF